LKKRNLGIAFKATGEADERTNFTGQFPRVLYVSIRSPAGEML